MPSGLSLEAWTKSMAGSMIAGKPLNGSPQETTGKIYVSDLNGGYAIAQASPLSIRL